MWKIEILALTVRKFLASLKFQTNSRMTDKTKTIWYPIFNLGSIKRSYKDAICQVQLKFASGFGEEFHQVFFAISVFNPPWQKGMTLCLNKLESPSPKKALCQVWLKLAQCFWWRSYFKLNTFILVYK